MSCLNAPSIQSRGRAWKKALLEQMREKYNMKLSKTPRWTCHLSVMELSLLHERGAVRREGKDDNQLTMNRRARDTFKL